MFSISGKETQTHGEPDGGSRPNLLWEIGRDRPPGVLEATNVGTILNSAHSIGPSQEPGPAEVLRGESASTHRGMGGTFIRLESDRGERPAQAVLS